MQYCALVSFRNESKEQIDCITFERDVAELVDEKGGDSNERRYSHAIDPLRFAAISRMSNAAAVVK